jgi:hypothetical protein
MTNVDELRETLEFHADRAPDGKGVVEAAQAIHRRRRRRAGVATVTAAAVLVAAVPLVVSRVAHPGHVAPAVSPLPPQRLSLRLAVDLQPGQSAAMVAYGVYFGVQYLTVRPQGSFPYSGSVIVYDPTARNTDFLRDGEKVKVRGHVAYYNRQRYVEVPANYEFDVIGGAPQPEVIPGIVSWQDPSGAWVIVAGAGSLGGLLGLAEQVRLGVGRPVVAPYRLGYLPRGARLLFGQTRNADPSATESDLSFDGVPQVYPDDWPGYIKPPLLVKTVNRTPAVDARQKGQPPTLKIAGHDAWWYTDSQPGPFSIWKGSGLLFVNVGNCQMQVTVDSLTRFPLGEIKHMVESAKFKDCTKPSTWVPPLG